MQYYIDLSGISLDDFQKRIKEADLLPSQQVLNEYLEERFSRLKAFGLKTMSDLQVALKSKKKLQEFTLDTGIPEDFLTILRREVNSYHPKPNNFKDFPGLPEGLVSKLEALGIKHTQHIFEKVITPEDRGSLAKQLGVGINVVEELTILTDLSRIKWVGPIFARLLYMAGIDRLDKISQSDHEKLYKLVISINEKEKFYRGKFGVNDMKLCVKVSKDVPRAIKY